MEMLFKRMEANNIAFIMQNTANRWLGIGLVSQNKRQWAHAHANLAHTRTTSTHAYLTAGHLFLLFCILFHSVSGRFFLFSRIFANTMDSPFGPYDDAQSPSPPPPPPPPALRASSIRSSKNFPLPKTKNNLICVRFGSAQPSNDQFTINKIMCLVFMYFVVVCWCRCCPLSLYISVDFEFVCFFSRFLPSIVPLVFGKPPHPPPAVYYCRTIWAA